MVLDITQERTLDANTLVGQSGDLAILGSGCIDAGVVILSFRYCQFLEECRAAAYVPPPGAGPKLPRTP